MLRKDGKRLHSITVRQGEESSRITRPDVDDNVNQNRKGDAAEGSADEGIDQILPADFLKRKTNGFSVRPRKSMINHVRYYGLSMDG